MEDRKYIALYSDILSLSKDIHLVHSTITNTYLKLPVHISTLLPYLTEFRTGDEHHHFLKAKGIPVEDPAALKSIFSLLIEKKIFICDRDICTYLKQKNPEETENEQPVISLAGWVTSGRIKNLEKSIYSFIQQTHSIPFLVCNDSPYKKTGEDIISLLNTCSPGIHAGFYYAGEKEKQDLITMLFNDLSCSGVSREVLEFALLNPLRLSNTCGANRNSLLLAGAGNLMMKVDDDIECRATAMENRILSVNAKYNPFFFRYFPDRGSLLEVMDLKKEDIVTHHQTVLGKNMAMVMQDFSNKDSLRIERGSASLIKQIITGKGKIRITMPGLCGESGMGSRKMVLCATGREREKVLASEEYYNSVLASREIIMSAPFITINQGCFLMSFNLGIDNRTLLPPFLPVERGSDAVFAALYTCCFPDDFTAYLPFIVYHNPIEDRSFMKKRLFDFRPSFSDLVVFLIRDFQLPIILDQPAKRFILLGGYLRELGSIKQDYLVDKIRGIQVQHITRYSYYLNSILEQHRGTPSFWADDICRCLEAIENIISKDEFVIPRDLRDPGGKTNPLAFFQQTLTFLGNLLEVWPLIYEKAKQYNKEGRAWIRRV